MLRKFTSTAILLLMTSMIAFGQTSHREMVYSPEEGGNRAFLGITAEKVSKEKAEKLGSDNPYGSYVSSVIPNTAAERAGIRPFDYIYGIDDAYTSRTENLSALLGNYEPNDQIRIHLVRNGDQKTVRATLGTREDADYTKPSEEDKPFFGVAPSAHMNADLDGSVIKVVEGSSADALGLRDGDRIIAFNTYCIHDWLDLTMAINTVTAGQSVSIGYVRDGKTLKTAGVMGSMASQESRSEMPSVSPPVPSSGKVFLGVVSDRLSSDKVEKLGYDNPYGYYVTEVVPGSAADEAGVQPFDYIYGLDQYRVGSEVSLVSMIRKFEPGDRTQIHLVRQGRAMSLPVTLTSKEEVSKHKKKKERNACEKPFLGVMQGYDADPNEVAGVQVNIVENSTAEAVGLEDGDIITHINGNRIVDWGDITIALSLVNPGDNIRIDYARQGRTGSASGSIKSYSETKDCDDCDCGKGIHVEIDLDELDDNFEQLGEDLEELGNEIGGMIRIRGRGESVATVNVEEYEVSVSRAAPAQVDHLNQMSGRSISSNQNLALGSIRIATYPEEQEFRLAFELPNAGDTTVEIYNPEGRRIYQYAADNFSGVFEDAVNIGQNGPGEYYLHISQDNRSTVRIIQLTKS